MARIHLTLAALATSAVGGLDIVASQSFGSAGGDMDSALLTGRDGRHWLIRVPRSTAAAEEQAADLAALRALSAGVRARLPFAVSTLAGQTQVDGVRAVVLEFVYGAKVRLATMSPTLAASLGAAIAAIHALPPTVATDAGLRAQSSVDTRRAAVAIVDRAAATGRVPASLLGRWEDAIQDDTLWQFEPTVINGSLGSDSILSADEAVSGILGWHGMRVGDPAVDLQWIVGSGSAEVADAALDAYLGARGGVDRQVRRRATLHAELEVARWLLHGVDTGSAEIVDDAVDMLAAIADDAAPDEGEARAPLDVDEVERLLERTARMR